MSRVIAAVTLCGWFLVANACGFGRSEQAGVPMDSAAASALDDSVHTIVTAYENGALTLESAARQLADLVEPTGGFAAEPGSQRANELFEATGRELRRRSARHVGVSDSLP
jgi:hypothetical protein